MTDRTDPGRFTSGQKVAMYVTTLFALVLLYVVPEAFKLIGSLPPEAWKAMLVPALVLVAGMLLVCAWAVWQMFSTGRMAIRRAVPDVQKLAEHDRDKRDQEKNR